MKPLTRVLTVAFAIGVVGCATPQSEVDYLIMPPLGAGWKVARDQEQREVKRMREFVRDGETLYNWTEHISWESFKKGPAAPSETTLNGKREFLRQICGDVIWNIISHQEGATLYEWRISNCKPPSRSEFEKLFSRPGGRLDSDVQLEQLTADQHAISLYLEGKWTVWHISYTIKVRDIPEEKRVEWIKRFSETKVETRSK